MKKALEDMASAMTALLGRKGEFPFLALLEAPLDKIKQCGGRLAEWYMTEFVAMRDELLTMKEELLEPATAFINGPRLEIYRQAREFLRTREPDLPHLERAEAGELADLLNSAECIRGNGMARARRLLESLEKELSARLAKDRSSAGELLARRREQLETMKEYATLDEQAREKLGAELRRLEEEICGQNLLVGLENARRRFEDDGFSRLVGQVYALAAQKGEKKAGEKTGGQAEVISIHKIWPEFADPVLASLSDVDDWLAAMRQSLVAEIEQGRKVQI